jgi:hypothetical protein
VVVTIQQETLLVALRQAKVEAEAASNRVEELQAALIEEMKATGDPTVHTQLGGEAITGTLVEATRIKVDEAKLAKTLGADLWNKVTKKVLEGEPHRRGSSLRRTAQQALREGHRQGSEAHPHQVSGCRGSRATGAQAHTKDEGGGRWLSTG